MGWNSYVAGKTSISSEPAWEAKGVGGEASTEKTIQHKN